jgi:hypothetical protein
MERHMTGTSWHVTAGAGLLLAAFVMAACVDTQETQEAQEPQETQVRVEAFFGER